MKRLLQVLPLLLSFYVQAQPAAKNVIVEHFTNTYCSVCFNRNPGFYGNLWQFPQVLHIAYYPSKPYPACPLNQHNQQEADDRTNFYGIYGATPRLVIQGNVINASDNYADATLFQTQLGQTTNFDVNAGLSYTGPSMLEAKVVVKKVDASSLTGLQLYVPLVEDTLFFNANNGETIHYNVFRKSIFGSPMNIAAPVNVGDSVVYTQQISLNSVWDKNRIYVIAILQDGGKSIVQVAKSNRLPFTTQINPCPTDCPKIYPNPVANRLFIDGLQGVVTYRISDITGKVVSVVQTENKFVDVQDLVAGVYILTITTANATNTTRFVKK